MGNCIKRGSRMQWGGEDWGSAIDPPEEAVKTAGADRIGGGGSKGASLKRAAAGVKAIDPPEEAVKTAGIGGGSKGASLKRAAAAAAACTEVKVKITKKQLEELIGKMEIDRGLTVQQVIEQLMKVSARFEAQERMTSSAWKPRLQSIPELKSFHSR